MARYVVNNNTDTNPNNDHEVHVQGCSSFPSDYKELGDHASCQVAIAVAKTIYSDVDGCRICSGDCHKS